MCTDPQRTDARLSVPPFLPANAACQVGVENEWNWRSGVDKIRGERQERGVGTTGDQRKAQRSHSEGFFPNDSRRRGTVRVRHQLVALKRAPSLL